MSGPRGGLAGSAALMFSGTAVSRLLGLVRNAVLALAITVNVAGVANAFSVANKLPNIIYMLVAGGVLNAVLVPQIVRAMRREDGGREYVDRLLTVAGATLAALTVVLTAAASLLVTLYGSRLGEWFDVSVAFAYWCIPQLFFYGLYTLLGQVLNARSSFGPYMWAPALNNVVAIAGLAVFIALYGPSATSGGDSPAAWTGGRVALLAGTATLGVMAQALILLVPLYRSGFRWRPRWGLRGTGLGTASRVASWAFAALAVGQLGYVVVSNVAAAAATAGGGAADVAGNAAYDNAFLIYMLPQSLITVSLVTAMFTRLSANAAAEDLDKVRGDLSLGLRVVGVFTVFATVALAVLAVPVARLVLPTVTLPEAQSVAAVTVAMLVGLSALGAWTLVQRVYYAFQDAKSLFWVQVPMAAIVAGGALLGTVLLEPRWWVAAAGLAMSASTIVGAVVAYLRLRLKLTTLDGARVLRTHLRLALAATPAALVGWGLLHLLGVGPAPASRMIVVVVGSAVRIAVVGLVMVAVYVVVLRLLRVDELDTLQRPVVRGLRALGRRVRTMATRQRGGSAGGGGTAVETPAPETDGSGGGEHVVDATEEAPVSARTPLEGPLAGRYRLVETLPTDLPGAVAWHARDLVLDRDVEVLLLSGATTAEALDAARRAALVEDPRLVAVLAVGEADGLSYVVTEVAHGEDVGLLVAGGPLPAPEARALVGEAASALEAARRRGVHHLALRPAAVRRTADGAVVVTGLGVDAAALGVEPGDYWEASRADAVGLVRLLFLALTGHEHGTAAPVTAGEDVVPEDLAALCLLTLEGEDEGPASPAELIRALAPWGDVGGHEGGTRAARPLVAGLGAGGTLTMTIPARTTPGVDDVAHALEAAEPTFDEVIGVAAPPATSTSAGSTPPAITSEGSAPGEPAPEPAPPLDPSTWAPRAGVEPALVEFTEFDDLLAVPAEADAASAGTVPRHAAYRRPAGPGTTAATTAGVSGVAAGPASALGRVGSASRAAAGRAVSAGRSALGRGETGRGDAGAGATTTAAPVPVSAPAGAPTIEDDLGAPAATPERPAQHRVFDPTPYVLALMLAGVVFGLIIAMNNLLGARTARTDELPEPQRSPGVSAPAGETSEALPDGLPWTGAVVLTVPAPTAV